MIRILDFLRNPLFRFTLIPIMFFVFYFHVSSDFPFWFIYDMDHITSLDLMLIHNESLPAHINHTGFGMYLILSLAQAMAKCFNLLTHIKLDDLNNSLNPLLTIGENIDFIRRFSPLALVSTFLFIGMGLFRFLKKIDWFEQCLVLVLLLSLPALYYHSAFVRTETYALFYWSLGFFLLSCLNIKNSNKKNFLLILFSGVFVGLAFLTKLQVVFYICLLPLILFYFNPNYKYLYNSNHKKRLSIALLNFLLVFGYFSLSWNVVIPPGFADFSAKYGLNIFGLAYLGYSFLNLLLCFFIKKIKVLQKWSKELEIISILVLGFSLSFLFHFLIYDNLAASQLYLSYNFKVLFLRKNSYSQLHEISSMLSVYKDYAKVFFVWSIGPFILVLITLINYVRKKKFFSFENGTLVLIAALLLLNTFVGARFMLRDLIWFSPMPVLLFLFFKQGLLKDSYLIKAFILFILICLNFKFNQSMMERINLNYNQYGFDKKRHLKGVYGNSRYPYEQYLLDKIGKEKSHLQAAFDQANHRQFYLNWAQRIFLNKEINFSHLGIMKEGFRFHPTKREGRIIQVPDELKNTLLVNFQAAENNKLKYPKSSLVNEHSEVLQKITNDSLNGRSILIPYRDTLIYVFFEKEITANERCQLKRTKLSIKIGSPLEVNKRAVYQVDGVCQFDVATKVYGIISAKEV